MSPHLRQGDGFAVSVTVIFKSSAWWTNDVVTAAMWFAARNDVTMSAVSISWRFYNCTVYTAHSFLFFLQRSYRCYFLFVCLFSVYFLSQLKEKKGEKYTKKMEELSRNNCTLHAKHCHMYFCGKDGRKKNMTVYKTSCGSVNSST